MLDSGKEPKELRDEVITAAGAATFGLSLLDESNVAAEWSAPSKPRTSAAELAKAGK